MRQILSAGLEMSKLRTSNYGRPAQLFQYVKEVSRRFRFVHIFNGALLWWRELAAFARC